MRCPWGIVGWCLLLSAVLLVGCGSSNGPEKGSVNLPDWLTETDTRSHAMPDSLLAPPPAAADLGLKLNPGDQFPLRKVVEQELIQNTLSGVPQRNLSRLELLFAISVLERRDDRIKLSVKYNRVKYQHHVADEHVEFDSTQPPNPIPLAVQAYHDMVNDGFAFWIGPDNQIVEVEGLTEFLNRCLRNVPEALRQDVVLGMEAGSGESGIANFVDNTIGLLPYRKQTSPGETWERQQQVSRPVPMHVQNQYTLKSLTDQLAVIDIRGTISPSLTVGGGDAAQGVRVRVNGGSTLGSCTIYRDTGLPQESRVDRTVDMTVSMAGAIEFRQQKRITTTVQAYPVSTGAPAVLGWNQAQDNVPGGNDAQDRVIPAAGVQVGR